MNHRCVVGTLQVVHLILVGSPSSLGPNWNLSCTVGAESEFIGVTLDDVDSLTTLALGKSDGGYTKAGRTYKEVDNL
jgi:hypothetical protein